MRLGDVFEQVRRDRHRKIAQRVLLHSWFDVSAPVRRIAGMRRCFLGALDVRQVFVLDVIRQRIPRTGTLGSLPRVGQLFRHQVIEVARAPVAVAIISESDARLFLDKLAIDNEFLTIPQKPRTAVPEYISTLGHDRFSLRYSLGIATLRKYS